MPRSWKKRGRDVPPAQFRFGTRPSTSAKCCSPAARSVAESSTVVLTGTRLAGSGRSDAVTTISSSPSGVAAKAGGQPMPSSNMALRSAHENIRRK